MMGWNITLFTTTVIYFSLRTSSFTIALQSNNHSDAPKLFTSVSENVVGNTMTGWHQD